MDDEKFEIDDGAARVVLYYDGVMVLNFKKINRNAKIVLTNGAQKTTSVRLYEKLNDYCQEQGYEVVCNQKIGEYHGHVK